MSTIELLETIGRDAALRYAGPRELLGALEESHASVALRNAISHGDCALLMQEFGQKTMLGVQAVPQSTQTIWRNEATTASR